MNGKTFDHRTDVNDDGQPIAGREGKLRALARTAADYLDGFLGGMGFALFVFDFGPHGFTTYISNANRDDMRRSLAEHLARTATFAERTAEALSEGEEVEIRGRRYRVEVVRRHRVQLVPIFNGDEASSTTIAKGFGVAHGERSRQARAQLAPPWERDRP